MAGGKESPRQKMINMMYLVLTAMLALQVSNALLQKFQLLNNSLERANGAANNNNEKSVGAIKKEIEKPGGEKYADVLRQAAEVRKQTGEMDTYINSLKQEIIAAGGGMDAETGGVKNPSEEEKVAILMVGSSRNGKGYELKKKLNEFAVQLQKFAAPNTKFPDLAVDASKDPALAVLSQKQSEVRRIEGDVLDYLASQVGIKEIKFDEIFAVVIPDSRSVVAGQKYHAEVAIGAYSKSITPRISINGSALPVKDGKGTYEITASGGDFDKNGQLKRSYRAVVAYPSPDGTMKSVEKEETYTVLKPSVQIETASMPPLYFKCANRLVTYSPGLGGLYSPTFSGTGGEFIAGGSGKVTIVPNTSKASMNVVNAGITLQTFNFPVRLVPQPTVKLLVNGGVYDERKSMTATSVRSVEGRAIADESFKATNPEDAAFRVGDMEVNLIRGTRFVSKASGGGTLNISNLAQQAQAGDRYVIIIKRVERKNFKGEILPLEMERTIVIPLN